MQHRVCLICRTLFKITYVLLVEPNIGWHNNMYDGHCNVLSGWDLHAAGWHPNR